MQMIVIGVDTHKRSHTLVALDAATGATRGVLTIAASDDGTLDAVRFAGVLRAAVAAHADPKGETRGSVSSLGVVFRQQDDHADPKRET